MEINWDTDKGKIIATFIYPAIGMTCVDDRSNTWLSTTKIVGDAIIKHLKGTEIKHTCESSSKSMFVTMTLELRCIEPHKDKDSSLNDVNHILWAIDYDIQEKILMLLKGNK